jgi:glycosyltransferase involved in cell wall biosynthesis
VLWIEKELWPWAPAWLERAAWRGKPVLLDYDDAIFHNYDLHRSAAVRRLYGGKIDALMQHASMVVAGNDYLAERARRAGAASVEVLPTVVDLERYAPPVRPGVDAAKPVVIGWIGSPATVGYLQALAEPLARVAAGRAIELHVIGASAALPGVAVVQVPWSEAGEVQAIGGCDIGIMPLLDSPWERGKCGYKLIQYMACGLPVVASPVGANMHIVEPGVSGFLADGPAQWEAALVQLADDVALRRRLGRAGRAAVEAHYSLQVAAPRLIGWLHELAPQSTRGGA